MDKLSISLQQAASASQITRGSGDVSLGTLDDRFSKFPGDCVDMVTLGQPCDHDDRSATHATAPIFFREHAICRPVERPHFFHHHSTASPL